MQRKYVRWSHCPSYERWHATAQKSRIIMWQHTCTLQDFEEGRHVFCTVRFLNIRGVILSWSFLTTTSSTVHWMVPQDFEQSEYTFKYFYLFLFQIFLRACAWEKNQDGVPFQVLAPLLSHIMWELPCPIASLGSNPCDHVCKSISTIIGETPLQKFDEEITLKFDKTVTKFQHLLYSILLKSYWDKGNYGVPTSLTSFWNSSLSLFRMSLYFWNSSAIFIFFTKKSTPSKIIDRKHMEFWHEKVMSSLFKIQNGHWVKSCKNVIII